MNDIKLISIVIAVILLLIVIGCISPLLLAVIWVIAVYVCA